jgi:uncharacterized protein
MIASYLLVKESAKRGRGVFTTQNIAPETIIEISPVLIFAIKEVEFAEKTLLYNYLFEWGATKKKRALGLGYISIYNHSYNANCDYEMDYEAATIRIKTLTEIKANEELFINYNASPNDTTPIWFTAVP